MSGELKFQLRLTLRDELAQTARAIHRPVHLAADEVLASMMPPEISVRCFCGLCERRRRTEPKTTTSMTDEKTIEDPAKKAKYTKSFALYVGGEEVYAKSRQTRSKPTQTAGRRSDLAQMFKYDTDPAHNPQPPPVRGRSRSAEGSSSIMLTCAATICQPSSAALHLAPDLAGARWRRNRVEAPAKSAP